MFIKIQPPEKTRRCLKVAVNKSINGPKISSVIREHCYAPAPCERGTRNLALTKALIKTELPSKSKQVLQVIYR